MFVFFHAHTTATWYMWQDSWWQLWRRRRRQRRRLWQRWWYWILTMMVIIAMTATRARQTAALNMARICSDSDHSKYVHNVSPTIMWSRQCVNLLKHPMQSLVCSIPSWLNMEMQKKKYFLNWDIDSPNTLFGGWKSPSLWLFCILFKTANNLKTWQFSNFKLQILFKSANNLKNLTGNFSSPATQLFLQMEMKISFAYFAIFSYDLICIRTFCINNNRVIISKTIWLNTSMKNCMV